MKSAIPSLKYKQETFSIEIRQKKREQILAYKRQNLYCINQEPSCQQIADIDDMEEEQTFKHPMIILDQTLKHELLEIQSCAFNISEIQSYSQMIKSNDLIQQIKGLVLIRKVLSQNYSPIQEVYNLNINFYLFSYLQPQNNIQLTFESLWILGIFCFNNQIAKQLLDANLLYHLDFVLDRQSQSLIENSIYILSNIIVDNHELDQYKFNEFKFMQRVIQYAKNINVTKSMLQTTMWMLNNALYNDKIVDDFDQICSVIAKSLKYCSENEIKYNCLKCLKRYTLKMNENKLDQFYRTNLLDILTNMLDNQQFIPQIINIIGNILTITERRNIQVILNTKLIDKIISLMNMEIKVNNQKTVIEDIFFILSNLAAENSDVNDLIVDNIQLINSCFFQFQKAQNINELITFFNNLLKVANSDQLQKILDLNLLTEITSVFQCRNDLNSDTISQLLSLVELIYQSMMYQQNCFFLEKFEAELKCLFDRLVVMDLTEEQERRAEALSKSLNTLNQYCDI